MISSRIAPQPSALHQLAGRLESAGLETSTINTQNLSVQLMDAQMAGSAADFRGETSMTVCVTFFVEDHEAAAVLMPLVETLGTID